MVSAIAIENAATKMIKIIINDIIRFSCSITKRKSRLDARQLTARIPGSRKSDSSRSANTSASTPGLKRKTTPCTASPNPYNSCKTRSVQMIIRPSTVGERVRNRPITENSRGNKTSSSFNRSSISGVKTSTRSPGTTPSDAARPSPIKIPSSSNSSKSPEVINCRMGKTRSSATGSMPRIPGNSGLFPYCKSTTPSA